MTTANDTIKSALRKIGVIAAGEAPTAQEATDGLECLNDMLHGFSADGIAFAHTTLALADNLPVPDEQVQHIKAMLAVYMAPEYGATPSPIVLAQAENARRYLQGAYSLPVTASADSALLNGNAGVDWDMSVA